MFRSKKFTIAFSILSVMIIALSGILIYLISGKGDSAILPSHEPETLTTEDTIQNIQTLTKNDSHAYPILDETITEKGTLSIHNTGDGFAGVTFHKKAAFDGRTVSGNVVRYSGNYDIVGKVYVSNNGTAALMYKTSDGYYVQGVGDAITYKTANTQVLPNPGKIRTYGEESENGLLLTVYHEDGNHMAFSLSKVDRDGNESLILQNVVAKYDATGAANFEYKYDGEVFDGKIFISRSGENNYNFTAKLTLENEIVLNGKATKEITIQ